MYQYRDYAPEHFATGLHLNRKSGLLVWESAPGQDSLMVQTPFGQPAADIIADICRAMDQTPPSREGFVSMLPGVGVRLFTAADKVRMGGCPLHGEASTYTVFGFAPDVGGAGGIVYGQEDQAMMTSFCDIPLEISVAIQEELKQEGRFRKRQVFSGFYRVSFPDGMEDGYPDGGLVYENGGLEIPVTQEMLEKKTIFIQSDQPPVFLAKCTGITWREKQ